MKKIGISVEYALKSAKDAIQSALECVDWAEYDERIEVGQRLDLALALVHEALRSIDANKCVKCGAPQEWHSCIDATMNRRDNVGPHLFQPPHA